MSIASAWWWPGVQVLFIQTFPGHELAKWLAAGFPIDMSHFIELIRLTYE
jgi:hypothetical protein